MSANQKSDKRRIQTGSKCDISCSSMKIINDFAVLFRNNYVEKCEISFCFSFSPLSWKLPHRKSMAGTVGQAIFSCILAVIVSLIIGCMVPYCFLLTPSGVSQGHICVLVFELIRIQCSRLYPQ